MYATSPALVWPTPLAAPYTYRSTAFPSPAAKWALESPPWPSFDGIAPAVRAFPIGHSHVGPLQAERLTLAERLRKP